MDPLEPIKPLDQMIRPPHSDNPPPPKEEPTLAGWLVMRLKPGEGVVIDGQTEVRLASLNARTNGDAKIAIHAPKHLSIRRVR